jgi:integrase/recombinase XerD
MASIKLILRKHQLDNTGHCPLYIRIIKDRKTKFITAGVKLKENEWDEVKQKVKKNHSNSARMKLHYLKRLLMPKVRLPIWNVKSKRYRLKN